MHNTTRRDLNQRKLYIEQLKTRTKVFVISFFPYCIKEWLKLGDKIRIIESTKQLKKTILDFIRPKENSVYAIQVFNY